MSNKISVAVLGATGPVGQVLLQLLENHPNFEPVMLCSSSENVSRRYGDAIAPRMFVNEDSVSRFLDRRLAAVQECSGEVKVVFSALSSDAAADIEPMLARNGVAVCSNASAFRLDPYVPVLLADINPSHVHLVHGQKRSFGYEGFVVANPNCSTAGLVTALSPLRRFVLRNVWVQTWQSISGAGYPGHSACDILGNVVPHIPGEERKIARETPKMLGRFSGSGIEHHDMKVKAFCTRVPVQRGHLIRVTAEVDREVTAERVVAEWESMDPVDASFASVPPVLVRREFDRPQPAKDVAAGRGMSVSVGRLNVEGRRISFALVVDNLVRGAAGAAVMNAELLLKEGFIPAP
ncbi:MAG: aspartate-semialdehyde dehydrogenase [Planctomycetota bacterium]|nr:aspartate-semialdehyde dehydrogenase [Planctomycetota bacterium]